MTNRPRRYFRIPKLDGVNVPFPISDYVLNIEKKSAPRKSKAPAFALQTASFALTLVLCASSFGITYGNPVSTLSYFRDDEKSANNILSAGLLGFRVNPGDISIPIKEGDTVDLSPLFEPKPDSFELMYRVHTEIVGEDSALCTLLQANGTDSPYIYSGAFRNLSTAPATATGHRHLAISLPNASGISNGSSCTIALIFRGWYRGAPENTGYTDEHQDTFTFVYEGPNEAPTPVAPESVTPASNPSTSSEVDLSSSEATPPSTRETTNEEIPPESPPSQDVPPTDQSVPSTSSEEAAPLPEESTPVDTPPADVPTEAPTAN